MSTIPGDTSNNHHSTENEQTPKGQYAILIFVVVTLIVSAIVIIFVKFCVDKNRDSRPRRTTGGAADPGFAMGAVFSGGADCGGGGGDCGGGGGDCGGF